MGFAVDIHEQNCTCEQPVSRECEPLANLGGHICTEHAIHEYSLICGHLVQMCTMCVRLKGLFAALSMSYYKLPIWHYA